MKIQLVGRIPSKKNSKQIRINSKTKKPFICSSKDHEEWHRGMSLALLAMRTPKPRLSGVSILLEFTFGDLRKSDLDCSIGHVSNINERPPCMVEVNGEGVYYLNEITLDLSAIERGEVDGASVVEVGE